MKVRARPTAHAGVVLAIVLGALPAATVGLDVAWVVVASGTSVLLLAPLLARRQVRAIESAMLQQQLIIHAGRTSHVKVTLQLSRRARHVLVDVTRTDARPSERERAPRLALASISSSSSSGPAIEIEAPIRLPSRGRTDALALTFESVFPFGLFRAQARLIVPCEVAVLPRVLRRGDRALEALLAEIGSKDDASSARPARRGSGLPAAFRPSRRDDTARDIAWRPSARRLRWISTDRSPVTNDRVAIVLVTGVRAAGLSNARRSSAAFEAAISVCATAVDRLTRAGREVTLRFASTDPDAPASALTRARSGVASRSVRALPHVLALTDVDEGGGESPTLGAGAASRTDAPQLVIVATALPRGANDGDGTTTASAPVLVVDATGHATTIAFAPSRRRLSAIGR